MRVDFPKPDLKTDQIHFSLESWSGNGVMRTAVEHWTPEGCRSGCALMAFARMEGLGSAITTSLPGSL